VRLWPDRPRSIADQPLNDVEPADPDDTILVPADDANERWALENKNVTVIKGENGSRIFLRIGGVVKDIKTARRRVSRRSACRMSFRRVVQISAKEA
jgi:hypothetical protein